MKTLSRFLCGLFAVVLLPACSQKGDPRLLGTWHSNQKETVAMAMRDPKIAHQSPEDLAGFTNQFGQLSLTYTKDTISFKTHSDAKSFNYYVIERGDDFVVIRTQGAIEDGNDIRIRFVEDNRAYWVNTGFGYSERFDKVDSGRASSNK